MNKRQKVLIVDDKPANLVALEKVLAELDAELIKAASGNEALIAILNHDFALAILDVQMPEMDGYELADLIRSDEKNKNLPVIFLSAVHSDEFHIFKGYEAGAVDFLTKPYNPFILLSKVKIFLKLDQQKNDLQESIEIAKSKNYLESILASLEEGILVTDLEFAITNVNKKLLSLTEFSENDLIGSNPEYLFTAGLKSKWEDFLVSVEAGERDRADFVYKIECDLKGVNGKSVPVLLTGASLNNQTGEMLGTVWSVTDISLRKKAEKQLLDSRERFYNAVKYAPFPIMIHAENGEVKLINDEWTEITGYTPEDVPDMRAWVQKAYGAEDNSVLEDIKEIYSADKKLDEGEYTIRTKTGAERIWYFSSTRLGPDENGVNTAISMALDITGLKQIENELKTAKERAEEISRLKSNFLANMSHELRTPLMGILGYTEVLLNEIESDDYLKMLKKIMFSGQRLSDTINSILDLTKVETEKITAELKIADINFTVNPVIELFKAAMTERKVDFQVIKHQENLFAVIDENLLCQVLKHLLHNALKYTHKGFVCLTTGKEKVDGREFISIKVADSGIGIPADKIDLIWEEFRQVSEGISRNFEGCGLGLTIVRKLTRILGGSVSVESELGKGSVFTLLLPASDPTGTHSAESQLVIVASKNSDADKNRLKKILYVEDDEINRDVIDLFLRGRYMTSMVKTASEAIDALEREVFDILLIDINLGEGMSGLELIKVIRESEKYRGIPAIAVTAYTAPADRVTVFEAGFNEFIPKPFSKHLLLDTMSKILADKA